MSDGLHHARRQRPQQAPAKDDVGIGVRQLQPMRDSADEGDHLIGQAVHDAGGHLILGREGKHDAGQLAETRLADLLKVQSPGHLEGTGEPEVLGHRGLEGGPRAAPVGGAGGRVQGRQADIGPAAPIAGDLAQGEEPRLAAIGITPQAVDAGPADHGDTPAAVGARTQERQRVVVDAEPVAPGRALEARPQGGELLGQVGAGEEDLGRVRERALTLREAGAVERAPEKRLEQLDRALETEIMRRASAAAHERHQVAVGADQGQVGLDPTPVHGKNEAVSGYGRVLPYQGFAAYSCAIHVMLFVKGSNLK